MSHKLSGDGHDRIARIGCARTIRSGEIGDQPSLRFRNSQSSLRQIPGLAPKYYVPAVDLLQVLSIPHSHLERYKARTSVFVLWGGIQTVAHTTACRRTIDMCSVIVNWRVQKYVAAVGSQMLQSGLFGFSSKTFAAARKHGTGAEVKVSDVREAE